MKIIDRRTVTGRALAKWRTDLITDLGGDVSTQQSAIIDLAVKSKLLLDSIDVWLLTQPSLINQRKRSLLPVVKERQALADALARYLTVLGLARRVKDSEIAPWDRKPELSQNHDSITPVGKGETIRAEIAVNANLEQSEIARSCIREGLKSSPLAILPDAMPAARSRRGNSSEQN